MHPDSNPNNKAKFLTESFVSERRRDVISSVLVRILISMLFYSSECEPARVEITRKTGEIRLTSAGLEWCDARHVKHVWRHNSEVSY